MGLVVMHAGLAAIWLGGMVYSLLVVQPKAAAFFAEDDDSHEAFLAALAAGNRQKVLALMAGVGVSGLALLAYDNDHLVIHAIKAALLLGAVGVFWFVTYRHWPTRVVALPSELPALRRQLRGNAWAIVTLVGTAAVLGIVASHLKG